MAGAIVLFGAFDRHNLGDLLFPHVAAALLPGEDVVCCGLGARDLRAYGGHRVHALAELAARGGDHRGLIHVGGEILTCDAWQAAVMLLPAHEARAITAGRDAPGPGRHAWAARMLGVTARAPYVVTHRAFPGAGRIVFDAVGGVELDRSDPALRTEVLAALAQADHVGVRERRTLRTLKAAGIVARLLPDPAAMVAELFGERIRERCAQREVAAMRAAFPGGYLAAQFSAEFGDDATLSSLAAGLARVGREAGLGVALFRAGAAPWHDDLECLQRLAARMPAGAARVFASLDIWDICALIAASRGYCGSSLHGRIVAMAFALPRVNVRAAPRGTEPTKHEAYAATWEPAGLPRVVGVRGLAPGLRRALRADAGLLRLTAGRLAGAHRRGFERIREALALPPQTPAPR